MKKIFISYGTSDYRDTLRRLKKEAKELGIFDKIIMYTPKDLPAWINANPLMAYKKGGGYWLWKPYIIWKTLQDYKDSIVVYTDAGCSLFKSEDWNVFFDKITLYNTIVFRYRDNFDYGWRDYYSCNSPTIKYWSKKTTLDYFDSLYKSQEWQNSNKILGGFIIAKDGNNNLIYEWLKISLFYPDLVSDPFGKEISNQYDFYIEHRHDQSILTPLAYFYKKIDGKVLIMDETAESAKTTNIPVLATRIRDTKERRHRITMKTRTIRLIKYLIGEKAYNTIHRRKNEALH